ncbi:MAG: CHAD domain-containing protein [Pseudomonadota bacterium]
MDEIELKVSLSEAAETRLRADRTLAAISRGRPTTRALRTVYFDTPDRVLARDGMALRLRKSGRAWVQTVKLGQRIEGGLSQAAEHSCPAPGGRLVLAEIPEERVRTALLSRVNGAALAPVFETRMSRTTRLFDMGGSVVEMAIDIGEIVAGDRVDPVRELELELVEGDPSALYGLLKRLLPAGGLAFSTRSKAERGMRLAEGLAEVPASDQPRRARPIALAETHTVETAAQAIFREAFQMVSANITLAAEDLDPDALKQIRVGLRRLRTGLALFRQALDGPPLMALNEEARWLAAEVGRVRDLDVAMAEIVGPEMALSDDPGFGILHRALARRRKTEGAALRETLAGPRVQAFLIDLVAFTETRLWLRRGDVSQTARLATPIPGPAAKAIQKRWRKAAALAEGIAELDIEARHELRKALKKLRYAIEFFRPLHDEAEVLPFLKRLKKLQNIFGDLNDAAMAEALFLSPDAPAARDPQAQRAAGRVIGARLALAEIAWHDAQTRWADLVQVPRFWR